MRFSFYIKFLKVVLLLVVVSTQLVYFLDGVVLVQRVVRYCDYNN